MKCVFWATLLICNFTISLGGTIDLSGEWRFQLDGKDRGIAEKWYLTELTELITLPSTTDLHNFGSSVSDYDRGRLTRRFRYAGAAWYQRTITIPEKWSDRTVSLFLERCQWESRVWLNDKPLGLRESLSVPHVYTMGVLTPGQYTLTIRVDNRLKYDISHYAAAVSDEAQTNWNGLVGTLKLKSHHQIRIRSADYMLNDEDNDDQDTIHASVHIQNTSYEHLSGSLMYRIEKDTSGCLLYTKKIDLDIEPGDNFFSHPLNFAPELWGEYNPKLYRITLTLSTEDEEIADDNTVKTGFRRFTAGRRHFYLNNHRLFLRGTLDVGYNPAAGHPFMQVEEWLHVFKTIKAYGLNHMRFHSWCPPKAAFEAADRVGIILQVECPFWDGESNISSDNPRAAFIRAEAFRILDAYRSHPSFCMMSLGNELSDPHGPMLTALVKDLKQADTRRLCTTTSGHYIPHFLDANLVDDFFISLATPKGLLRGVIRLGDEPLDTRVNYNHKIDALDRPVILHELGQWAMYPDLSRRHKYTGNLIAGFLHNAQAQLENRGMAEQAEKFAKSSGTFAATLYKEEIEAAYRSDFVAGFQLLGLTDFPGWGAAIVGVLDEFWDSKNIIAPEQFRQFCNRVVLLFETETFVIESGTTLQGRIRLANYSKETIKQDIIWQISDETQGIVAKGVIPDVRAEAGQVSFLGTIRYPSCRQMPKKLTLDVRVKGTDITNQWPIWVYPKQSFPEIPDQILFSQQWDQTTRQHLAEGGKVLLTMRRDQSGYMLQSSFLPIFWAFNFNPAGNSTLGTLLRQDHPVFSHFFSQTHSHWNLQDLYRHSDMLVMDTLPKSIIPLIQPIDSFNRNFKLGKLFEARVLEGKLMVSSIDLYTDLEDRPVTRLLLNSIFKYMQSDDFAPACIAEPELLDTLLNISRIENAACTKPLGKAVYLDVHTESGKAMAEYLKIDDQRSAFDWPPVVSLDAAVTVFDGHTIAEQADGFDFSVSPQDSEMVTAYLMDGRPFELTVYTPHTFEGFLWVHFQDWNTKARRAKISYQGHDWGFTDEPGKDGRWYKLPITTHKSAPPSARFQAHPISGPNVLVSRFMITE